VSIRKNFLGTDYDDMGNPKTYTKAQLAELKGKDTTKPGYTAKLEDLQPGQEVVVYLTKPKKTATKAVAPAKKEDGDDEKKPAVVAELGAGPAHMDRPMVTTILMTKEMPSGLGAPAQPAAKKKK